MPIEFKFYALRIPFRVTFKHAHAQRRESYSILVEALSETGAIGYGESCPRSYVTGETFETASHFYNTFKNKWRKEISNVDSLRAWVNRNREKIDQNPAAWCAVEMALIDSWARAENTSWESQLGLRELDGSFQYSAILGDQSVASFEKQLAQYQNWGFSSFKVKLSGNREQDASKQAILHEFGIEGERLRWDANNLWNDEHSACDALNALDGFAIEEPLRAGDYEGMRRVAHNTGKKIILDESLLRTDQVNEIQCGGSYWIINLRVSKMGGLLRSLDVARMAKQCGIPLIIGAQVGETSLLSRAALTIAHESNILAQEGAFGTRLLEHDVCSSPVMFGQNGLLHADHGHLNAPLSITLPGAYLTPLKGNTASGR